MKTNLRKTALALSIATSALLCTGCNDETTIINGETGVQPSGCMDVVGYPYQPDAQDGFTMVGGVGFMSMAFKGDTLYGITTANYDGDNHLMTINTTTGEGTEVANMGFARIYDIAIDPLDTRSDRIYGFQTHYDEWWDINSTSGNTNYISDEWYETIAFTSDGTAYATDYDELYQLDINHTTGEIINSTYIGDLNRDYYELAYNSVDGKLYGASDYEDGAILRIDVGGIDDVNETYVNKVECIVDGVVQDGWCSLAALDFDSNGVMYGMMRDDDYEELGGALVKWNSSCGDYYKEYND